MKPKLIPFNEPASALGLELVHEVSETMEELSRDHITMIVATHEMRFARQLAILVVFVDKGVVVEQGPPEQLFIHPVNSRLFSFPGMVGALIATVIASIAMRNPYSRDSMIIFLVAQAIVGHNIVPN